MKTTANISLAIVGLMCFYDTFVVKQTIVLRMSFSAEKPRHRQAVNRNQAVMVAARCSAKASLPNFLSIAWCERSASKKVSFSM